MTTQSSASFDFVAETKGHCFLCSSKTLSWNNSHSTSLESSSMYSLHCLSRYLNMDMKKVFNVEGPLPPHLVVRVEKSRLKAELCQECVSLTETFSRQLRQLEKIQMEVTSGLSRIHQKLEQAVKGSCERKMNSWSDPDFKDEWVAKLEITEALRMEAIQKCSHRLGSVIPLAKLERLTDKQVNAEKLMIKLNCIKADGSNRRTTLQDTESYRDEDIGSPLSVPLSDEEMHDYANEQDDSISSPVVDDKKCVPEIEALKQEVIGASQHLTEPNYADSKMREKAALEPNHQTHRDRMGNSNDNAGLKVKAMKSAEVMKKVGKLSQSIPPPIKVPGNDGIERQNISLDPETCKYNCPSCSKEFACKRGCQHHYDSAHLKVKHKCGLCDKDFPQKTSYETHYLNIHMGVKFKCGECDKTFANKNYLVQHQNSVHLGRQYKCTYCDEKFNLPQYRYAHMKKKCPNRKDPSRDH